MTSMHENAREAKTRLQQYKAKIVQEMVEESKELMRQALEEVEQYHAIQCNMFTVIRSVYNFTCYITSFTYPFTVLHIHLQCYMLFFYSVSHWIFGFIYYIHGFTYTF